MPKPTFIVIDGPGAVGKSVIGNLLAQGLGYRFFDTGAMYRALTWLALELGFELQDENALAELALGTNIELAPGIVLVDGRDVTRNIHSERVEGEVSLVAKVAGVRHTLVARQRQMAQGGKVVMAGRDIGTVVLPDAELKIYLAASTEERARRRYSEIIREGKQANYDKILAELRDRDKLDSERALAPLKPAPDAKVIDTDGLGIEQVLAEIMSLIEDC
jgi:cytidylate kinase